MKCIASFLLLHVLIPGDLRRRMKDKRDKIERQSYAARVLGDLMGGGSGRDSEGRKVHKRTSDQMKDEEEKIIRKRTLEIMKKEKEMDESEEERKDRKRRSDQMKREDSGEEEEMMSKVKKDKREDSPVKQKKKKKSEKKEKKEKKSKKSKRSVDEDNLESGQNALQMVQEYEPIRSRKMKIKRSKDEGEEIKDKELSLDASHDDDAVDQELAATEDVLKDLDDFLND